MDCIARHEPLPGNFYSAQPGEPLAGLPQGVNRHSQKRCNFWKREGFRVDNPNNLGYILAVARCFDFHKEDDTRFSDDCQVVCEANYHART